MKKAKTTYFLLFFIILLALGGCSGNGPAVQVEEETPVKPPSAEEIKQIDIEFADNTFAIPNDMAMFHSASTMYPVDNDMEELFLNFKGQDENVCMLRASQLTAEITETEDADAAMRLYCDPVNYNSADIVFEETTLHEYFYVQSGITTTLEDKTNSTFTLIPKYTDKIYSVTFLSDSNGTPVCSVDDTKIILNSLQRYSGVELKDDYFYSVFRRFLDKQSQELYKYKAYQHVPVLADEATCDLDSDTQYYLDLESGLYTLEALEGEGEVAIEDSRFGSRVLMLGYNSTNAPITLSNITLVHGGGIKTNLGLKIRIIK